jgi:glycosyltransferase involved in cell wall biosynthesis
MTPPYLSIAMCTYNGSRHILEQLQSFAHQTRLPDELVVCDDGSSDDTIAIIQRFAVRAPFPVRLFRNECNLGTTGNFQKAIGLCGGEIILLSDQDDWWYPQKLARIETCFRHAPELGLVFGDALVTDDHLKPIGFNLWQAVGLLPSLQNQLTSGDAFAVLLKHYYVTGATLAFRTSLCDWILPIPREWFHDAWIALIVASRSRLTLVSEPLMAYRQHQCNQIGARRWSVWERMRQTLRIDRDTYYHDEIKRYGILYERLQEARPIPHDDVLQQVRSKLAHLTRRSRYPEQRFLRWPFIVRELLTASYSRFSKNWQIAIRDLLLQAHPPCPRPNTSTSKAANLPHAANSASLCSVETTRSADGRVNEINPPKLSP